MIDALAGWSHYGAHVFPLYAALPEELQGTCWVDDERLALQAKSYGIDAKVGYPTMHGPPVIVASHNDMNQCHPDRAFVYLEHGAGQTYRGVDSPSYSGGPNRGRVALFLTLNDETAKRERARYPDTPVEVIGSPRVDELAKIPRGPRSEPPVVAFAWHAHMKIAPETRATYPFWWPAVKRLHADGAYRILGHGHPREWRRLASWYETAGIEATPDLADVIVRADLLCVDNTSAGPEAAACGLPVLWLDAPHYRRDVEHHGRFWDWPNGQVCCDDPDRLAQRIALALADTQGTFNARQVMVDEIYPPATRGEAARLGVEAIVRHGVGTWALVPSLSKCGLESGACSRRFSTGSFDGSTRSTADTGSAHGAP